MEKLRVYTTENRKRHRLVKAATSKKLTSIRIVWAPKFGTRTHRSGWTLESDQVKNLHLGFEILEAETRISKITLP